MEGDAAVGICRAMIEDDDGLPLLAQTATGLGIRRNKDIIPDHMDMVHLSAFRPRGKNGLSCSRTIPGLPHFALPVAWGGTNDKTVVWQIEESDLGAELTAGDDAVPGSNMHVSLGPSGTMTYNVYVSAIAATPPKWKKVIKN